MLKPTLSLLKSVSLFSKMRSESIERFLPYIKWHTYEKGALILRGIEVQDSFLYLVRGAAKLSKKIAAEKEILLDILTQGCFLDGQFLFEDEATESCTVEGLSSVEVITFPLALLRKEIEENAALSLDFFKATLERQERLRLHIEHLRFKNAVEHLSCFLLRLGVYKENNRMLLEFPCDQTIFAAWLGMRVETFSRVLKKLVGESTIQEDGKKCFQVQDVKRLVDLTCQRCSKTFPCKDVRNNNLLPNVLKIDFYQ